MDGLTPGVYTNGVAHVELSLSSIVRPSLSKNLREVSHLYVPPDKRRQWHATKLMSNVCEAADKAGLVLMLAVQPGDNGPTEAQLIKFYERCGFAVIQSNPTIMSRVPQ